MELYTRDELIEQIKSVDSAINAVISGGKTYRLNDGMGDVQVTRESLPNLKTYRDHLAERLNDLDYENTAGIVSIEVTR
ncbi:hypothetical protein [Marispirochaeta aestuarii]|uniref:hypothetical protein n=1 Tax=Marispirochaeta aestuarii TaxID=1963862 RepID=UPI0011787CD8|nr:hypothetical protein [Marispirochaeta aestuarii]